MSAPRRAAVALSGMLVAAAASTTVQAADLVVVRTVDDHFDPAEIMLEHGKAYRLRIENVGKEMHEFKAAQFFGAARLTDAAAMTPDHTELIVQPGQTKEVELTAPAAGTYDLTCPDHDWDNMVGKIVVK